MKGNSMNQFALRGLHHVSVQTIDWEASLHLYITILGMRIALEYEDTDKKLILLDTGNGTILELFAPNSKVRKQEGPLTHFALATLDTRESINLIRHLGYTVTMEATDVEMGDVKSTIAFFEGPNGESVEFFEVQFIS